MESQRKFKEVPVNAPDGQVVKISVLIDNHLEFQPYNALLIVKTKGEWRFVCEYWEKSVAIAQAKVYQMNPMNEETAVLDYPEVKTPPAAPFKSDYKQKKPTTNAKGQFTKKSEE